jgi:hypothetical protein
MRSDVPPGYRARASAEQVRQDSLMQKIRLSAEQSDPKILHISAKYKFIAVVDFVTYR